MIVFEKILMGGAEVEIELLVTLLGSGSESFQLVPKISEICHFLTCNSKISRIVGIDVNTVVDLSFCQSWNRMAKVGKGWQTSAFSPYVYPIEVPENLSIS